MSAAVLHLANLGLNNQLYACIAAAFVAGMYAVYLHTVSVATVSILLR